MYGIVANVISDRALRTGAKVYLLALHGDTQYPKVYGLSKSPRMIRKYTSMKRLERFRAAWIPPHIEALGWCFFDTRLEAESWAERLCRQWAGIRSYTRDGQSIRHHGAATSEAFKRI